MAGIKRNPKNMEVLSRAELLRVIEECKSPRDRALICLLYLTGARISEVVKDLKRKQISKEELDGKAYILLRGVITLKKDQYTGVMRRAIPIIIDREKPFLLPFINYINKLDMEAIVFPFTRQWGWKIVKKRTGLFPHFLRHLRYTHMITEYGFTAPQLAKFAGWKDIKPTSFYVHLDATDLVKKMFES